MFPIMNPHEASFPARGGNVTVKIGSTSESIFAFKVKTSKNGCYRVQPMFGFIEPKADTPLKITRIAGPPKDDALSFNFLRFPLRRRIRRLAAQAPQGIILLPLKAA